MSNEELIKNYVPKPLQNEALQKVNEGYPVQYIIGNVDFMGYLITVNENVLIPRFETEFLVDKTLKILKQKNFSNPQILELGTGSGCISIALAKNLHCEIDALDINEKAISLAKKNAQENSVEINFITADMKKFRTNKKYDIIISNPPYVPINSSYDDSIKYEPASAIFAANEGLEYYKVILERYKNNLKDKYLIALEIGDKEGENIKSLAEKNLPNSQIYIEKDYNNYERYVFITNIE